VHSAEKHANALQLKMAAAAPLLERELQLAGATSHASGDHCVPLGQAFQLKGEPDRKMYVITSTNRCQTLGVYLVPDGSSSSIQPALKGIGGRPGFAAKAFTVDDAHAAREETMGALNAAKLEVIERFEHEIKELQADGAAEEIKELQAELESTKGALVQELLQDLKHFSSRPISTLTCGPANQAEFRALVARIKGIFRTYCPVRDAHIDAMLSTPSDGIRGIRVKGRVMMRKVRVHVHGCMYMMHDA
jgi:hypothetical protein